ncbi:MAG TPA: glycosyltransferase, partial [Gammaproteobacteria bacterium]|nr:glycosyltransferase [Gammaproteobacteria bacterium]
MTNLAIDTTTMQPDYTAIKAKQQATWGAGNYGRIGVTLQITGEQLCETMDLRAGRSVLDVAAGNGNVTLAAARRFCRVTSTDYVDSLLRQSEQRALVEGMSNVILEAMASALPLIATRTGAAPEIIRHGVNGLLVDPGRPEALAAAIA